MSILQQYSYSVLILYAVHPLPAHPAVPVCPVHRQALPQVPHQSDGGAAHSLPLQHHPRHLRQGQRPLRWQEGRHSVHHLSLPVRRLLHLVQIVENRLQENVVGYLN